MALKFFDQCAVLFVPDVDFGIYDLVSSSARYKIALENNLHCH